MGEHDIDRETKVRLLSIAVQTTQNNPLPWAWREHYREMLTLLQKGFPSNEGDWTDFNNVEISDTVLGVKIKNNHQVKFIKAMGGALAQIGEKK